MNELSLDLIIHPGETIKEVLDDRNMNQEELAIRTGFTPKHVSEVIKGKKGISPAFAKSLEYVFGMPASFWLNLQNIYDEEMIKYQEQNEIEKEEFDIVKKLKGLIEYAEKLGILEKTKNKTSQVIEIRKLCNVNNLTYINKLPNTQAVFRKSQAIDTNFYVLYVWMRICEINATKYCVEQKYDEQKLLQSLDKIKKCMFFDLNEAVEKLTSIFADCGIIFQIIKNFPGAPIQGFIKKTNEQIILSMTIRRSFADEFWFTLFHEIGHLIDGDIIFMPYIDYENTKSAMEDKADNFAKNILINEDDYEKFISKEKITAKDIIEFAKKEKVEPFIVVGRIQKECNDYTLFSKLKRRYKWE